MTGHGLPWHELFGCGVFGHNLSGCGLPGLTLNGCGLPGHGLHLESFFKPDSILYYLHIPTVHRIRTDSLLSLVFVIFVLCAMQCEK